SILLLTATASTETYTLSLHDALPISAARWRHAGRPPATATARCGWPGTRRRCSRVLPVPRARAPPPPVPRRGRRVRPPLAARPRPGRAGRRTGRADSAPRPRLRARATVSAAVAGTGTGTP